MSCVYIYIYTWSYCDTWIFFREFQPVSSLWFLYRCGCILLSDTYGQYIFMTQFQWHGSPTPSNKDTSWFWPIRLAVTNWGMHPFLSMARPPTVQSTALPVLSYLFMLFLVCQWSFHLCQVESKAKIHPSHTHIIEPPPLSAGPSSPLPQCPRPPGVVFSHPPVSRSWLRMSFQWVFHHAKGNDWRETQIFARSVVTCLNHVIDILNVIRSHLISFIIGVKHLSTINAMP